MGCVKVLSAHQVSPLSIQSQSRQKSPIKLNFLAQIGGSLLAGVPSSLLHGCKEDHQLKVAGCAFTQDGVKGAPAVQYVIKSEWENKKLAWPLAQIIQVEVQGSLVQCLTFMLFIKNSTHLYVDQRLVHQVGHSNHETCLALVLAHHCLWAELDGCCSLLRSRNLGYKCTCKFRQIL